MLLAHLDYNCCQPKKLSWAHSDQELGRIAGMVASLLRSPTPCQTAERGRRGRRTASWGRRGLPLVGAVIPACGHERCNQAWGISAWFTTSDCWNALTSDGSTWAVSLCLWALFRFVYKKKENFQISPYIGEMPTFPLVVLLTQNTTKQEHYFPHYRWA